jgi:hypothetical protein
MPIFFIENVQASGVFLKYRQLWDLALVELYIRLP